MCDTGNEVDGNCRYSLYYENTISSFCHCSVNLFLGGKHVRSRSTGTASVCGQKTLRTCSKCEPYASPTPSDLLHLSAKRASVPVLECRAHASALRADLLSYLLVREKDGIGVPASGPERHASRKGGRGPALLLYNTGDRDRKARSAKRTDLSIFQRMLWTSWMNPEVRCDRRVERRGRRW